MIYVDVGTLWGNKDIAWIGPYHHHRTIKTHFQQRVQSCLPLVIMIPRAAARVIPKIIRPMTTTKTKNEREV